MASLGPQPSGRSSSHVGTGVRVREQVNLKTVARQVADAPEFRRSAVGFIGYGDTSAGDRVLLAVPSLVEPPVVEAVAGALRDKGAKVDIIILDEGIREDRAISATDEEVGKMRREPLTGKPRLGGRRRWVRELAESQAYDLLIHGTGGFVPKSAFRWEAFPWWNTEQLLSECNTFPQDVHRLINERTWARITGNTGARVHLTDPEGTDLEYTILEGPLHDGRHDYGLRPKWGHLMAHNPPPVEPTNDATGVIAGTMNEFGGAPFPRIEVHVENARMVDVVGGGEYGDAWRALEEESRNTEYPCFPGPGLFWLWEVAIGTNPKVRRLSNFGTLMSHGFGWERRRAGIVHCGIGTRTGDSFEDWAGEHRLLYGHLHVQLGSPTLTVIPSQGPEIPVIEDGRLAAFDDAEVRDLAARHGDPDVLLRNDFVPPIPGLTVPGSYAEYAADPVGWLARHQA